MNAVIEPKAFALPKKPRVKPKDAPPDQRKVSVLPIRAGKDQRLHGATLRCLIVLCSYCNRAGLTWVGQAKLAQDLQISRQAVTKQIKLLTQTGYVEVVRKGFRGENTNTLRVIYDTTVDAETAIAITSVNEDNRPPTMQDNTVDPDGQRRVQQLIKQALSSTSKPKKEYTMPDNNETLTVKKMKEEIAKKKGTPKRTHKKPPEVAIENHPKVANLESKEPLHRQPDGQLPEVALNAVERIDGVYEGYISKEDLKHLKSSGLSDEDIKINFECLRDAYKAEGLPLPTKGLVDQILNMGK